MFSIRRAGRDQGIWRKAPADMIVERGKTKRCRTQSRITAGHNLSPKSDPRSTQTERSPGIMWWRERTSKIQLSDDS